MAKRPQLAHDERVWQFVRYCKVCLKYEKMAYVERKKKEIPVVLANKTTKTSYEYEQGNDIIVAGKEIQIQNDELYKCLIALKQQERDVLYLSVCRRMKDREIAELLQIPRSTVQYIKYRAKEKIRQRMGEYGAW